MIRTSGSAMMREKLALWGNSEVHKKFRMLWRIFTSRICDNLNARIFQVKCVLKNTISSLNKRFVLVEFNDRNILAFLLENDILTDYQMCGLGFGYSGFKSGVIWSIWIL